MNRLTYNILKKNIEKVKKHITFGVELEGNYNADRVAFDTGDIYSYHGEENYNFLDFFKIEEDSSIHGANFDSNYNCELISKPLKYSEFDVLFYKLKEALNVVDYLGYTVTFNKSTGAHMHISINNSNFIKKITNFNVAKEIEKRIYAYLNENLFLFQNVKDYFYRAYAKKLTKNNFTSRYVSVNTHTDKPTIEIRAINLNGISSLSRIYILYKEILDIVILIIAENLTKNTIPKQTEIYINKKITTKNTKSKIIINGE